jgi:hypothetical protein
MLGFQSLLRAGLVAATSSALAASLESCTAPIYGSPSPDTGGSGVVGGTGGSAGGAGGESGAAGQGGEGGR